MEIVVYAMLAFAVPILIIRAIAAIPAWFMVVYSILGLTACVVATLQDLTAWSLWLVVPIGIVATIIGLAAGMAAIGSPVRNANE